MKIMGWDDDNKSLSACRNGIHFVLKGSPAIFLKLRIAEIYIYTDSSDRPVKALFALADYLYGSSTYGDVVFEGLGSFTALSVD
jgi:hypothetical protein